MELNASVLAGTLVVGFHRFISYSISIMGNSVKAGPAKQGNTSSANRPVETITIGGVSASIFRNRRKTEDGESYDQYSVSISRRYFSGGRTHWTNSLGRRELLPAIAALQKSCDYIHAQRKGKDEGDEQSE